MTGEAGEPDGAAPDERALALAARYGRAERLLHRLALGMPAAIAMADRIDAMAGEAPEPSPDPVHIAGLARSGTTLVLELLAGTGAFTSLTYRAMPFVAAPRLWGRVAGRRRGGTAAERAHGDGLGIALDSPEALEEVFWRGRLGDRQMAPDRIRAVPVSEADIAAYRGFVARVLAAGPPGRRYLAKNTVSLTRLGAIARAFPEAVILVPFRDPQGFAASVLRQHARFRALHARDPFTADYMAWLGHTEFGARFRPLGLPGVEPPAGGPDGVTEDWLLGYWTAVHRWLLDAAPVPLRFVSLARLRAEPETALADLAGAVGIGAGTLPRGLVEGRRETPDRAGPASPALAEARRIYDRLEARSRRHG